MKSVLETSWPQVGTVKPVEKWHLPLFLKSGEEWQIDMDSFVQGRNACWRFPQDRYLRSGMMDTRGGLCGLEEEVLRLQILE